MLWIEPSANASSNTLKRHLLRSFCTLLDVLEACVLSFRKPMHCMMCNDDIVLVGLTAPISPTVLSLHPVVPPQTVLQYRLCIFQIDLQLLFVAQGKVLWRDCCIVFRVYQSGWPMLCIRRLDTRTHYTQFHRQGKICNRNRNWWLLFVASPWLMVNTAWPTVSLNKMHFGAPKNPEAQCLGGANIRDFVTKSISTGWANSVVKIIFWLLDLVIIMTF